MTMVGFNKKQFFFDRQIVIDAVGRAGAKNLSKAGSFIRRSARSSLRRRKKASPPGEPPSVHSQDRVATLKNIWFVFDPRQRSVVVGPLKLNGSKLEGSDRATVPALHERGGVAVVKDRRKRRRRRAKYAPRPFMGPAMERELPKFEGLWANSVK
jgi:hypothetical protein